MSDLKLETAAPLAWLILNRPERRNAVTSAMWQGVPDMAQIIEADDELRVALLRGAGQEAFSAGADIAEMQAALSAPERMRAMQDAVQVAQDVWARLPIPTIAVIHGACGPSSLEKYHAGLCRAASRHMTWAASRGMLASGCLGTRRGV